MIYAPVFIATLNRYEHLKKCLESLSHCTGAEQTEVYVALDYPPTDKWDKYAPGWEKNRDYLHSCGNMGFKKLHLIERTENYGIWNPGDRGNLRSMVKEFRGNYNRYIISEDDNVFAPAFLEYMNKGLEKFENDENVVGLTGYKLYMPELKFDKNNFFRQSLDYNAWGIGLWTKKQESRPKLDYMWYRKHLTLRNIKHLWKKAGIGAVCQLINLSCFNKRGTIDINMWTYLALTDKQQIIPRQTLVENIGFDGSGASMGDSRGQEWCDSRLNPLSTDLHFDFEGTGYEYFEENQKVYSRTKYYKSNWQYVNILFRKIIKLIVHWKS